MEKMFSSDYFSLEGPRGANGDSLRVVELAGNRLFACVADGVGGSEDPSLASSTAVTAAIDLISSAADFSPREVCEEARQALGVQSRSFNGLRLETTLVCLLLSEGGCRFLAVGDTRIYHLRGRGLITRTVDQTEAQMLMEQGILTRHQAARYHRRNVLTSAISSHSDFEVQTGEFEIAKGDRIVVSTDGFYSVVKKRKIVELSTLSSDTHDFAARMELAAIDAKPKDDATVLVVDING